jgi:hypothetical protein
MKNIKEQYIHNANSLIERLLDEQPEDDEVAPEETEAEIEEQPEVEEEPEQGQSEQVEIFFNNLDEESQKVLMDALKQNLNVASDDDYANQKLVEALSQKPLMTIRAEEIVRKLNIDI